MPTSTKGNQLRLVGQSMIGTTNPVGNKWKNIKLNTLEGYPFYPQIIHEVWLDIAI
ncbi:MAG: hypothetical protein WKF36_10975 [Candidatus Nitrosocosmicus sp.]